MSQGTSLIIRHSVHPQRREDYEAWLSRIINVSSGFAGQAGVNVMKPHPGAADYVIAVRFNTAEQAVAWTSSPERAELINEVRPCLIKDEDVSHRTGIDNWFEVEVPNMPGPKRWKQWLLTTAVIWVLTMIVPLVIMPLLELFPPLLTFGVRHLLLAAMMVALVIYIVMPQLSKWLSGWLHR